MTADEILKKWQEEATPPFKADFMNREWRHRQARRVRALIALLRHQADAFSEIDPEKLIEDADD